jgi:hypothetical protein
MYIDAMEFFRTAARIRTLYHQLLSGTVSQADIGLSALKALSSNHDFIPFWSMNCTDRIATTKKDDDMQLLNGEIDKVNTLLDSITGATATKKKTDQDKDQKDSTTTPVTEADREVHRKILTDIAVQIQPLILQWQLHGVREIIYFILNFIAWYGYGMCIVVYYFPIVLQQPDYIRVLLFYYHNDDADWYGNFAGDVMWTLEPIIVLLSPYCIQQVIAMTHRRTKTSSQVSIQAEGHKKKTE